MTGLSVLFNLNTEEACYIYGNMDSYRRLNEQAIQERYTAGITERSRTYRDLRYVPSSDLSSYTSHYAETAPRYRSQYGLHTDSVREPYHSYTGVNSGANSGVNSSLYSDGGSMSTYTRNYDARNRNIDITPKSFDPHRLFDRKSPDTDRSILDLGTDFRRRYHSDKTQDVATSAYGRDTGGEVSTRSPARSKSLKDHERPKEEKEEPVRQPFQRQRINSGDSVSSQTSERSDKGDNSKALFKAYQNRYKEHAEDSSARTPFSTWRRSGNFEDEAKYTGSKSVDAERPRIERQSKLFKSVEDHSGHGHAQKELKYEGMKKIERPQSTHVIVSPKEEHDTDKGDELMFNFRQALRRHQISEERKTSEERDSSKEAEKSTAEMIEKIRAAKAQIKQLKESQTKSEDSRDIQSSSKERHKLKSSSSTEEKTDANIVSKAMPKLARQKLVSDDLKAKYIENKKEETVRPIESESVIDKQSQRKHKEYWETKAEKPEDEEVKATEADQSHFLQTDRKNYRKTIAEKFKKESAGFEFGTSFTSKPKSVDGIDRDKITVTEKPVDKAKQSEEVIHTKEEIQSTPSNKSDFEINENGTAGESEVFDLSHKPVYSLVYQEPSTKSSFTEPYGVSYSSKSSSDQIPSYKSTKNKDVNEIETDKLDSKSKATDRKPRRQMKKHTKAKSVELGLLSHPKEEKAELHESKDDTSVVPNISMDEHSRKERIDKYKEERKKQLATIFGGGDSEHPSLFLSSRSETDTSPLSRSRSLKVESDNRLDSSVGVVGRSKSMKEGSAHVSKISGLQLAELGSQPTDTYAKHDGSEVLKQTNKSAADSQTQKGIDKSKQEITHRTMLAEMVLAEDREHTVKTSLDKEADSGHESTDSAKRIRRQLPSLEDVLGTNIAENGNHETKQDFKQQYTELKKPRDKEKSKTPVEFSLDYSKVKITPKSIPVEMSHGQVIPKRYEKTDSNEELSIDYSTSGYKMFQKPASDQSANLDENELKSVQSGIDHVDSQVVDDYHKMENKDNVIEISDTEIPKDSVSKMSKYFMHSENQGGPESLVFASDFRKPKITHDIKHVPEVIKLPEKVPLSEEPKKDFDINQEENHTGDNEFDKHSERKSSTPERVISVSEAWKLFSESSGQHVFGTDFVHKTKESEQIDHTKYTQAVEDEDTDTVVKDPQTVLKRQMLLGVKTPLAGLSESFSHVKKDIESQQKIQEHHPIPTKDESVSIKAAKPPLSPRTERKRASEAKFGKVSYRSNESDDSKFDLKKDRERSKSRELSKEKEIIKPVSTVKERSPSVESIQKTDSRSVRSLKERSPSIESISKPGVTKISYRDLERAKHVQSSKFETDIIAKPEKIVFGSDYRKSKTIPDSVVTDDHVKSILDVHIKDDSGSEHGKQKIVSDHIYDKTVSGNDYRKPKARSDVKERSDSMLFGSDFRKPKAEVKANPLKSEDVKIHDSLLAEQSGRTAEQPTASKTAVLTTDKDQIFKNKDIMNKKPVLNVVTRSISKEEKYPVSGTADAKIDIKAEAVSAASGQIIEVPVSPRQKSPPKIVSLVKQDAVPKTGLKSEVKLISKPRSSDTVEEQSKTFTNISLGRNISESSASETTEKESARTKPFHVSSNRTENKTSMTVKTADKEKTKPVQYVHPSPLLTFSAKTESPKKLDISPDLGEKMEGSKSEGKERNLGKIRDSDKQFISRRAKEEEWKKPVDTTSEFHQKTVEKMLLDTSLDDILSRNVDYLSDTAESPGSSRGRAEKKTRPQSVHEESRSHGRTKRIFKKKNLQRSKSEDRSHFKVDESGVVQRSKGTEDLEKSKKRAGGTSRSRDSREETEHQKNKSKKMEWQINRVTQLLHLKE